MKTLNLEQMNSITGGSNRQCYIDGVLIVGAIAVGAATGGWGGVALGVLGGLFATNSNGCL